MADPQPEQKEEEQKVGLRDFNHQCYLNDFMAGWALTNEDKEYANFKKIGGPPHEALNVLIGKRGVEQFFELRPHQIAALVPQIRLFTMQMEKPPSDNKIKSFAELSFGSFGTDPANNVSAITNSKELRGDGVGITSFDITTQGTNPAETGLVKCALKLHFQHPGLLINPFTTKSDNVSNPNVAPYRYLDLIWHVRGQVESEQPAAARMGQRQQEAFILNYKPTHNMLAVTYGWALPPGGMNAMGFTGPDAEKQWTLIKKAIAKSQTTIFLTLVQHSIEYNQDGTLNLDVEYQGSIESLISSPFSDVLELGAERHDSDFTRTRAELAAVTALETRQAESVGRGRERLAQAEADDESSGRFGRSVPGFRDNPEETTARESLNAGKDNLQALKKKKEELTAQMTTAMYTAFINALDARDAVLYFDLPKDQIEAWRKSTQKVRISDLAWEKLPDNEKKEYVGYGDGFYYKQRPSHQQVGSGQGPQGAADQLVGDAARGSAGRDPSFWQDSNADVKKENMDAVKDKANVLADSPKGDDVERVHYVYLGEILEVAASVLQESKNPDIKNLSILVGGLEYSDIRANQSVGPRGNTRIINLADIAISFEEFMLWFTDTVIRRERKRYLFKDFIKDICTRFVVAALGENCLGGVGPNRYNIGLSVFSAPGGPNGANRLQGQKLDVQQLGRLDIQKLKISDMVAEKFNNELKNYQHYLYIYIVNASPKFLMREESADVERGIYHVGLGRDAGLVKNIKFNKIDTPYLGEAKLTSADAQQTQLRHKYNADLSMIGNSFFAPGQYIYIDPSMAGMGDPRHVNSLAFQLGLGGYYSITEVQTKLSRAGFATDLKCVWESFGAASS